MTGAGQGGFAASGAVGRYWLARCDGFEVCSSDGRLSGTVAGVELNLDGRASTIYVERHHGPPLELGLVSVALVDPWQQLVVVTLPPRTPRTAHVRAASAAAARGGQAAWAGAAKAGAVSVAVAAAGRRAAPRARGFSLWLGARLAYLLAFLSWLYSVAVFTATRVVVLVVWTVLRGAMRVGFRVAPPFARSVQTTTRRVVRHLAAEFHRSPPSRAGSRQRRAPAGHPPRKSRRGSLYW